MPSVSDDQGATQVLPQVQMPPPSPPAGPGAPPTGGTQGGTGGGGGKTWLVVALAVLAALVLGGAAGYIASGLRIGGSNQLTQVPTATVAATPTATTIVPTTPAQPSVTPPVTPPATEPAPDTTAPKTPKVTFPALNYWLSPDDMKVEITWSKVTDRSGVSYVLEFADWLGGGAGWTPVTRITPVKRLYYQRVVPSFKERYRIIAIDGAGNESAPSAWRFLMEAASASDAAAQNAAYH